jgi:hypothetical protein
MQLSDRPIWRQAMTQSIDVIVIFDKAVSIPKPLRFKIYDRGQWKSVNVDRIYNSEWVRKDGKVQIVYSCGSKSCNGQMINYKLMYIQQEVRWEMEIDAAS